MFRSETEQHKHAKLNLHACIWIPVFLELALSLEWSLSYLFGGMVANSVVLQRNWAAFKALPWDDFFVCGLCKEFCMTIIYIYRLSQALWGLISASVYKSHWQTDSPSQAQPELIGTHRVATQWHSFFTAHFHSLQTIVTVAKTMELALLFQYFWRGL